jgi:O-antigen/teichoic acid export membrane protein/peptidoglycan/xylan/chitin deacetylase (PgdA/CDA1 family)
MTTALSGRKAVGISFATQYTEMGIQFVSVMVLARILSPSEIGTFSVAALLMTVLHVFRDFGVAQYIIQEREMTRAKVQAAMGVAIILALAVAAALFAISGTVARFYANPALRNLLLVMSCSFAISPFGSVVLGLLRREGQLAAIFCIRTASAICHVTVAITLAMRGHGAISLAWANFAGILAFGVAGNLVRPPGTPWLPRFRDIRAILSFGSISSLGNLANIGGSSAPELVIGKVLSMAAVGYFSRATGLVQLFTRLIASALAPLVLPYFAQVRRDGQNLARPYLLAVEQLTAVAWPFFAVLLVLAYPVTRALYGPQWDPSVPVARLLCLAGAVATITQFAPQALVANGQVRRATSYNLLVQPVRVAAVLLAAFNGLEAVAHAIVLSELLALLVASMFLQRALGVHFHLVARACAKSALVTAGAVAGPLLVWRLAGDAPAAPWPPLLAGIASAALGWAGMLWLTRHPLGGHLLPLLGVPERGASDLKDALKRLAYRSGALDAWHRARNRDTLTVSMFHRVLPRGDARHAGADPEWTMTPESLERCLAFFKRHYNLVGPEQVFAALRGEAALPPRSMLVTFDDGWADTAEYAQPVLDRHQVRALVFVAAGAVGSRDGFWEERLYCFLATAPNAMVRLAELLDQLGLAPLDVAALAAPDEALIRTVIGQLGRRERAAVLALAARLPGLEALPDAMLSPAQLAGLAGAGHAIGGHGLTHQPLTRVAALAHELDTAQADLAQRLGAPVASMSLPHGASSPGVLAACRQAGYRHLFDSRAQLTPSWRGVHDAPLGRVHLSERAFSGRDGRFEPALLALALFGRAHDNGGAHG